MMAISNQDLIFKLKSIGVRVEGEDAHIDSDIITAILQGKKLPHPREVILRDESAPPEAARRRPTTALPPPMLAVTTIVLIRSNARSARPIRPDAFFVFSTSLSAITKSMTRRTKPINCSSSCFRSTGLTENHERTLDHARENEKRAAIAVDSATGARRFRPDEPVGSSR